MELFGSEHYVNTNSSSKDNIKMVINLEARGTSGPLIMFETSLQNKQIIQISPAFLAKDIPALILP
jgi:hypothetical protein